MTCIFWNDFGTPFALQYSLFAVSVSSEYIFERRLQNYVGCLRVEFAQRAKIRIRVELVRALEI